MIRIGDTVRLNDGTVTVIKSFTVSSQGTALYGHSGGFCAADRITGVVHRPSHPTTSKEGL